MTVSRFLSLKPIKWVVIPGLLLLFWLTTTLILINADPGLTILVQKGSKDNFKVLSHNELLAGNKVKAEFKAKYNNLGIIAARFQNFNRISDDYVVFRLKEKGKKSWYYENKYLVDQFQPDKLFTFGFPIIEDSINKTYQFEIESIKGSTGNAVAISPNEPIFISKYEYTKQFLLKYKKTVPVFLHNKIINQFSNIDFVINFLISSIPLLAYFFRQLFFDKYFSHKYLLVLFPILLMLIESLYIENIFNRIILVILMTWIVTIIFYKLESRISFLFALLFLSYGAILILFNSTKTAERLSLWAYWFLVIGAFQQVWELKTKPEKLLSIEDFIHNIYLDRVLMFFGLKKNHKNEITFKKLFQQLFIPGVRFIQKKIIILIKLIIIIQKIIKIFFIKIKKFFTLKSHSRKGYIFWFSKILALALLSLLIINHLAFPKYYKIKTDLFLTKSGINKTKFVISAVEPFFVHHGDKIIIQGRGYNQKVNKFAQLMSNYGKEDYSYASDSKIIFTVPLKWKTGTVKIWLEKYENDSGIDKILKSNIVTINILPRLGPLSYDDVSYFSQIKYLNAETKKLNEFRNYKFGKWIIAYLLRLL